MGLQEDFTQAAEDIKKLTSGPTNDDLLLLYSLVCLNIHHVIN